MIKNKITYLLFSAILLSSLLFLNNNAHGQIESKLAGETKGKKAVECGQYDGNGNQTQSGNTCSSGGQGCAANPCAQ